MTRSSQTATPQPAQNRRAKQVNAAQAWRQVTMQHEDR